MRLRSMLARVGFALATLAFAPPALAQLVPLFVAQGDVGRTTISCDDGLTWIEDQSNDDAARCFEPPASLDCDFRSDTARGIEFGDGYFVATFGRGQPGEIVRSQDGVTWTPTLMDQTSIGDLSFGDGVFVAADFTPKRSLDAGATWSESSTPSMAGFIARRAGFIPGSPGRHVVVGNPGEIGISSDGGDTFSNPTTVPASCGASATGLASGGGVSILVSGDGQVCRSTDGGTTWAIGSIGSVSIEAPPIHDGAEFRVWSVGQLHRSVDGVSWTSESTQPASLRLATVSRSDAGTLVGVRGGFRQWYDAQEFYRSTDGGATWQVLPPDAFTGSHPIHDIAFGYGVQPAACVPPAPVPLLTPIGLVAGVLSFLTAGVALSHRRPTI